MAEKDTDKPAAPSTPDAPPPGNASKSGGAAVAKPKRSEKSKTRPRPPQPLPPWKVLLHNDDKNDMEFVVLSIVELTPLNQDAAIQRTIEAHKSGLALLLVTHKEKAELYQEQFQSKGLTVTIEPDEK